MNTIHTWLKKPISDANLKLWVDIPEELKNHILLNIFPVVNPNFIQCVDDRTEESDRYGIYAAGGSQGIEKVIFSLLNKKSIEYNEEEIHKLFLETIGWWENFYMHSEEKSIDDEWACGCWDMNLALNWKHASFLTDSNKDFFRKYRKDYKDTIEVLKWDHNAQGVIIIDDTDVSIIPQWKNGGYFIYNEKVVKDLLNRFIKSLSKKLSLDISLEDILNELEEQTQSTLKSLWADLSVYKLTKTWEIFWVEKLWIVKEIF